MRAAGIVALTMLLGCKVSGTFACEADPQCSRGSEFGRCEPTGFCSYADGSCESGSRYDDLAGRGLAGTCVGDSEVIDAAVDDAQDPPDAPIDAQTSCLTQIDGGEHHMCAVKTDGSLWCWGRNTESQLAGTVGNPIQVPTQVPTLTGVAEVSVGDRFTCAQVADESLVCFGLNGSGQIGNGMSGGNVATPTPPMGLGAVLDFAAGGDHACAIKKLDGSVWCWGRGTEGQVGDNLVVGINNTPRQVLLAGSPLLGATAVAAGRRHSCAVAAGTAYCWGEDAAGQVGNDTMQLDQPMAVSVLANVTDVAAGFTHTCAIENDGSVSCWGENNEGQLGDGNAGIDQRTPSPVLLPAGQVVGAVTLSVRHTCALIGASLYCWGDNTLGQIANAAASTDNPPAIVSDLGSPSAIGMSFDNTCAIHGTTVECRGGNRECQSGYALCDGVDTRHEVPMTIALGCP